MALTFAESEKLLESAISAELRMTNFIAERLSGVLSDTVPFVTSLHLAHSQERLRATVSSVQNLAADLQKLKKGASLKPKPDSSSIRRTQPRRGLTGDRVYSISDMRKFLQDSLSRFCLEIRYRIVRGGGQFYGIVLRASAKSDGTFDKAFQIARADARARGYQLMYMRGAGGKLKTFTISYIKDDSLSAEPPLNEAPIDAYLYSNPKQVSSRMGH